PPGDVPATVLDLDRVRAEVTIDVDVWYALEAYVALTSNTVQFGANAELEATAAFLGVTYTAHGRVGFDVLLQFSPFELVADFVASVAITAGDDDKELLSASLTARLEGPQPWFATGTASFDLLGLDVAFDVAVGSSAPPALPPRQNVLELVATALRDPAAWRAEVDEGADASPVLYAP